MYVCMYVYIYIYIYMCIYIYIYIYIYIPGAQRGCGATQQSAVRHAVASSARHDMYVL